MLKPSKLSLRWEESWKVSERLYDNVAGIPATHAVLRSESKGKELCYAVHGHMPRSTLYSVRKRQRDKPIAVGFRGGQQLWWYADVFYKANADLTADDVVALVHEAENNRRLRL